MNEIIYILTIFAVVLGFAIGRVAFDPFQKTKFLRKIKRKPLGIAFFFTGNELFYKIIDLSKDVVKLKQGVFLNIPETNYVLKDFIKEKIEGKPVQELIKQLYYKDGVPCVFYDFRSITPVVFEKTLDKTFFALPEQVQAILQKEIVLSEAEILNLQKKKITNLLYIILFVSAITLAISFISFSEIQNVSRITKQILNVTAGG
jgi:hypothetical protein